MTCNMYSIIIIIPLVLISVVSSRRVMHNSLVLHFTPSIGTEYRKAISVPDVDWANSVTKPNGWMRRSWLPNKSTSLFDIYT